MKEKELTELLNEYESFIYNNEFASIDQFVKIKCCKHLNTDIVDCESCNGTGEGRTQGQICSSCGGIGIDTNVRLCEDCGKLIKKD